MTNRNARSDRQKKTCERSPTTTALRCPVVAACGEAGEDENYGVWGGLTAAQRFGADVSAIRNRMHPFARREREAKYARVRELARSGLAADLIAESVGYSTRNVNRIVSGHVGDGRSQGATA